MNFPLLYDAHHGRHLEDLPFWFDLARRQGGPILELGCGTGRVLLPLAQAGFELVGLDIERGMLDILRQNLTPDLRPRVRVFQADLIRFSLAVEFPLVLLPCNTYSTLAAEARSALLVRVRQCLKPGGIFAASLPSPYLLEDLPAQSDPEVEEVFPHPVDGEPVQVSSGWERTQEHFNLHWYYDHLTQEGNTERLHVRVQHQLVSVQTYLDELLEAGFTTVETFGDFDRSPFYEDSENLILVAHRSD